MSGPGSELLWALREQEAQRALAPLSFLCGAWVGEGQAHGEPLSARLLVVPILAGSFLEANERLYRPDGALDHEDRAFYRWDPSEKGLRVLHLMAPAWTGERAVEILEDGAAILWTGGPETPRVLWRQVGPDALLCAVFLPGEQGPSSVIHYRRESGA